jgi:hypothetical protein
LLTISITSFVGSLCTTNKLLANTLID